MPRRKGNVLSFRAATFSSFLTDGALKRAQRHGKENLHTVRLHRRRRAAGLISYLSAHVVRKKS